MKRADFANSLVETFIENC